MYEKELKIAQEAVKKAEPTFRKYFGTKPKTQIKKGDFRNIVSFVDRSIEKQIRVFLLKKFPNYGFIGEESGKYNQNADLVWIVDPIDGTTNYIYGSLDCAISIALLKKGNPVLGLTYSPVSNRLFWAIKGGGAKLNGKIISVAKQKDLKNCYGGFGWGQDVDFAGKMFPKLVPRVAKLRVLGSNTLSLGNVGAGIYDFYIGSNAKIWDCAAGQVIVEEAGGIFINSKKPRLQIAANKVLAQKILKLFH